VRYGCILAPAFFSVSIDGVLEFLVHMSEKQEVGIGSYRFTDLVSADIVRIIKVLYLLNCRLGMQAVAG